jgi:hypothetical protein
LNDLLAVIWPEVPSVWRADHYAHIDPPACGPSSKIDDGGSVTVIRAPPWNGNPNSTASFCQCDYERCVYLLR